ncbi:pre-rRNA-processing protein TSR2 homolog isoform X2 [Aquila chrysaetos chrysaetos]|uniref:pre-rRNA-processing protein TSR2 homolog isoform X2 n=1 Tax=Aquila chrysaetos chrysaetos TaxID=223781 RepID=UPI0011768E67|nr:pre-rRNA-processing protein TSR2 homolog isoform X2 [Aquila chrysaetos chrysaetos]
MAAPGLEEGGLFARGVRAVLGGWAALQLAVAHGFGGPQSPEKATWLAGALQEFFAQNELGEEEVEEFLAEVMDNEFDTAVEDGSLRQVSRELVTLFAQASRGDAGGVGEALGALARRGPALRAALATAHLEESPAHAPPTPEGDTPPRTPPPHQEGGEESSEEEEDEEEEAMECGTPPPPPDGWTLDAGGPGGRLGLGGGGR